MTHPIDRILYRVRLHDGDDARTGCWTYDGAHTNGFAQCVYQGRSHYVGRLIWEHFRGEIPTGHSLFRDCQNTRCVNPDHMEPMPHEEASRRTYARWRSVTPGQHCLDRCGVTDPDAEAGRCWRPGTWAYCTLRPTVSINGKPKCIARVLYRHLRGDLARRAVLVPTCGTATCANPWHQEIVLQGALAGAHNAEKTHCKHGHEYTPENTYRHSRTGSRMCRVCMRESEHRSRRKQR